MNPTVYGPGHNGPRPNFNEAKSARPSESYEAVPVMPCEPVTRPTIESQVSDLHLCAESLAETVDTLHKRLTAVLWQDPGTLKPGNAPPCKSYPCTALDSLAQLEYKLVQVNIRLMDINSSLAL